MNRLPTFIVAGAMRCGTTSLNSYLREHPEIAVASSKEVHFFDDRFDLGMDWYLEQFSGSEAALAVGEATPNYMFDPKALDRMREVLPEVKLVVVLRNPIDRAYSHYWLDKTRGFETAEFADVVDRELAGQEAGPGAYVARGRYRRQIEDILERFPRSALLVHTFEELTEEPGRLYASVCRHLGVDDGFAPPSLGRQVNEYVEFRSLAVRRWSSRLPKRARNVVGRLNARWNASYPPMAPALRRRLAEEFTTANAGLDELLDRPLPAWR